MCCTVMCTTVPVMQVMSYWYFRAFVSGFCVAVPVTVTVLDRVGYVARVDGASMQVKIKTLSTRFNTK